MSASDAAGPRWRAAMVHRQSPGSTTYRDASVTAGATSLVNGSGCTVSETTRAGEEVGGTGVNPPCGWRGGGRNDRSSAGSVEGEDTGPCAWAAVAAERAASAGKTGTS